MEMNYYTKHVYGRPLFYPHGVTAHKFSVLLGVKTFTKQQLDMIRDLGYNITEVLPQ